MTNPVFCWKGCGAILAIKAKREKSYFIVESYVCTNPNCRKEYVNNVAKPKGEK